MKKKVPNKTLAGVLGGLILGSISALVLYELDLLQGLWFFIIVVTAAISFILIYRFYKIISVENAGLELSILVITAALSYKLINNVGLTLHILLSVCIGVIVAGLYSIHNTALIRRWETSLLNNTDLLTRIGDKANELISPIRKSIQTIINEILPIYDVFIKMPLLKDLASSAKNLMSSYDEEILSFALQDQVRLMNGRESILTLDSYLALLNSFGSKSSRILCLNKTLPIYWYSPKLRERKYVKTYAHNIRSHELSVFRMTRVKNKDDLLKQIEHAYDEIAWQVDECIEWFLVLLQKIGNGFESIQEELCSGVAVEVEDNIMKYIRGDIEVERIKGMILSALDKKEKERIKGNIKKIMTTDEFLYVINVRVAELFVNQHGEEGSYYVAEERLREYLPDIEGMSDYGEVGVYLDKNAQPLRAFATVGELGEIIKLKVVNEKLKLFEIMDRIEKSVKKARNEPDQGNMKYIYDNG